MSSARNPTLRRIMKEASELASQPSPDYHAAPLETDVHDWHFTLRGPPAPSPFAGGAYHGRIILPPAYPLKPPSFRFLTPTGRFEANREICLSISGHHEETWQPAWGIRTALVALRSFMDTDARGQLGGMDATDDVRRRLAAQSAAWTCPVCAKANAEILREQQIAVTEAGVEAGTQADVVPEELRLAYREDAAKAEETAETPTAKVAVKASGDGLGPDVPALQPSASAATASDKSTHIAAAPAAAQASGAVAPPSSLQALLQAQVPVRQAPVRMQQADGIPPWIDKAIMGIVAAIALILWQRFFL